jgi:hypothetical protein
VEKLSLQHIFPTNLLIKTYVALCESCRSIAPLQLLFLEIFKFVDNFWSFAISKRLKRNRTRDGRRRRAPSVSRARLDRAAMCCPRDSPVYDSSATSYYEFVHPVFGPRHRPEEGCAARPWQAHAPRAKRRRDPWPPSMQAAQLAELSSLALKALPVRPPLIHTRANELGIRPHMHATEPPAAIVVLHDELPIPGHLLPAWAFLHLATAPLKGPETLVAKSRHPPCQRRSRGGGRSTTPPRTTTGALSNASNPQNETLGEQGPFPTPFPAKHGLPLAGFRPSSSLSAVWTTLQALSSFQGSRCKNEGPSVIKLFSVSAATSKIH